MPNAMTPMFRVSYPSVFKTKYNKLNEVDEYSLVAIFPNPANLPKEWSDKKKENWTKAFNALKATVDAELERGWPNKATRPKSIRNPFRKAEDKMTADGKFPDGFEAGGFFLNLRSTLRPAIFAADGVTQITDPSKFYAGCYARANVSVYAYGNTDKNRANPGVGIGLSHLQFMDDGDSFSGRPKAEDAFEAISSEETDANSIFN